MLLSLLRSENTWVIKSTDTNLTNLTFKDHPSALVKFRSLIKHCQPKIYVCECDGSVIPYWIVSIRYSQGVHVHRFDDADKRDEFINEIM